MYEIYPMLGLILFDGYLITKFFLKKKHLIITERQFSYWTIAA